MSTDQQHQQPPAAGREPDWWHRDHPTFTALAGFFTGLAFVIIVPGLFAAALGWLFDYHTAEDLFPLVLVALAVPVGLIIVPRTRRFGRYMLVGIVTTALVVGGVAALVLWYMVNYQG
jgi:4-amino-4-deoxy-L-arabinose transferase-like glycosyltransferase